MVGPDPDVKMKTNGGQQQFTIEECTWVRPWVESTDQTVFGHDDVRHCDLGGKLENYNCEEADTEPSQHHDSPSVGNFRDTYIQRRETNKDSRM